MYIVVIARGYPNDKYPLNGIFEFDQAKALTQMGCKVVYLAVDVRSMRWIRKWGFEQKKVDNVDIYAISIPCGGRLEALRVKLEYWGLKYIYRIIEKQEGKPDLLHAHFFALGYQAARLNKEIGVPLVITEHSSMLTDNSINAVERYKATMAYYGADSVLTVSPHLQSVLAEQFKVDAHFIPNMYDPKYFYYRESKPSEVFNFISVGSLIGRKRMALLIDAFHKTAQNADNIRLSIYGDGPEKKNLELMIKLKKLANRVELCGYQPRKEIAKKMQESNCFVLASSSEPFGVVYIEALACGLPVVATQCGGPQAFINANNGIIVPVDDCEALSEAMRHVYDNHNKYNRELIAKETLRYYGPKAVAEQLMGIYGAVTHGKS